jgi:hypothetical protein
LSVAGTCCTNVLSNMLITSRMMQIMSRSRKGAGAKYRSAITGRYVKPRYGRSHPNITVKESTGRKKRGR